MSLTNYARGRNFEYRVRKDLVKRGYVVIRAAQSKGPADLVAVMGQESEGRPQWVLFVQCKLTEAPMGVEEWNTLFRLARGAACVPVLAKNPGPGRKIVAKYFIMTEEKDGAGGPQPLREFQP